MRRRGKVFLILKEEILSQQQTKEKTGEGSPIIKEEILSQQQTKGKMGEGSPYPKGRNSLSTTNQGEDGRWFSLS